MKTIAELLQKIGEPIEVYYEPRNTGQEWYVGLARALEGNLPIHDHFAALDEGLEWLAENTQRLKDQRITRKAKLDELTRISQDLPGGYR